MFEYFGKGQQLNIDFTLPFFLVWANRISDWEDYFVGPFLTLESEKKNQVYEYSVPFPEEKYDDTNFLKA